jgi:SWI/SNF-related matrix-associated actin-dependent regulator 1 of chromatin subfamily A
MNYMDSLSFNEANNAFILTTENKELAEASGMTLSNSIKGPNGESVFYTSDYNKQPEFNPYAAMPFWQSADDLAMKNIESLVGSYQSSWAKETNFVAPAPDGKEPMPFQNAGVEYAVNRTNTLIGDQMGLGKTIQAILIANAISARRVLILCPASIRLNWAREIRDWSVIPKVRTYPILKSADGVSPTAHYVICSYDLARNPGIHAALCQTEWDLLILDEGHYLKSLDAQRTRAVFGGGTDRFKDNWLANRAKHVVAMTGTPLPNRPRECYTMARALDWESIDFLSYDRFLYRYNPSMQLGMHSIEERGRLPELQARLRCNIMVRRLKKDVLPQLPDKRYEMTYIEPNGAIKEVLQKEALIDFDPDQLFEPSFSLDGTPISTLRREMGEAKTPRAIEHIRYLLDIVEVPKIVVFCHHKSVMDMLIEALHGYGIEQNRGGMTTQAKDEAKLNFISGDPRIFIVQLDTSEGIDGLQHVSSYAVFVEPAWRPGTNEQCVDRCHRIGQHDNVVAQFIIAEGSFDEKVLHAVIGKAQVTHEVLDARF